MTRGRAPIRDGTHLAFRTSAFGSLMEPFQATSTPQSGRPRPRFALLVFCRPAVLLFTYLKSREFLQLLLPPCMYIHNMSAARGLISSMASLITNINDDKFAHDRYVLIRVNPFLRRFRLPSTTPTLPSFYHHQVPSLILHLERGRETRDDADRHLHRPTAAITPQPIERTASAARGTNNTTNSYNQQLRKTITAITRTRKKNHTKR